MASHPLTITFSVWTPIGRPSARLLPVAKNHHRMAIFLSRRSDSDAYYQNRRRHYSADHQYHRRLVALPYLSSLQAQPVLLILSATTPFLQLSPLPLCFALFLAPRRGGPRDQ